MYQEMCYDTGCKVTIGQHAMQRTFQAPDVGKELGDGRRESS